MHEQRTFHIQTSQCRDETGEYILFSGEKDRRNMTTLKPQKTVLVVDDDENILNLLELCLAGRFCIRKARSGEEALRIAKECCPDLLLLDLMMPKMNGQQVCRELRTSSGKSATIPVIVLSAKDERSEFIHDPVLRITEYIPKPFDPEELVLKVSSYLN